MGSVRSDESLINLDWLLTFITKTGFHNKKIYILFETSQTKKFG